MTEAAAADTAETEVPAETATPETTEAPDPEALARELDKWKQQSRKHEERAKANANAAKQLDEIRKQQMDDTERAVADARVEAQAEAAKHWGGRTVIAEIRAAAKDRNVDVDALAEGIDPTRFIVDGEVDNDAISAWVDRLAPLASEAPRPVTLGQGARPDASAMALNGNPLLESLKQKLDIR